MANQADCEKKKKEVGYNNCEIEKKTEMNNLHILNIIQEEEQQKKKKKIFSPSAYVILNIIQIQIVNII